MNEYASRGKKYSLRSGLVILLVLLILLAIWSAVMLFSQLSAFGASAEDSHVISLTEGGENSTVEIHHRGENGDHAARRAHYAPAVLAAPQGRAAAPKSDSETGFSVYDANTVWTTHTDVEIFRVSYDSEAGFPTVSVESGKGDKVFAPGTEEDYSFTLSNTGAKTLDYILTIEAFYENTDGLWIPIEGRLSDGTGAWLVGSATEWPDVLELDGFRKEGKLAAGSTENYRIDWRWPFERFDGEGLDSNDAYDTMLGNLAVDKDLILHIIIRTEAWLDEEPEPTPAPTETPAPSATPSPTNPPKTGDESHVFLWAVISLVSLAAIIVLIVVLRRGKKQKDDGR